MSRPESVSSSTATSGSSIARPVGTHQSVDLALGDRQVDAAQDLTLLRADVQVANLQFSHLLVSPVLRRAYTATGLRFFAGVRSESFVSCSVRTIERRTR